MENPKNRNGNPVNLIKELISEMIFLAKQHINLIKQELTDNVGMIIKAVILVILAMLISYAGLIFLGLLIVSLLSSIVPAWLALLLVTLIYLGIPLIFILYAFNLIYKVLKEPKKFITEIKKTGEEFEKWLDKLKK